MPSHTISRAKSGIGRALLVGKQPSNQQKDAIWAYFESQCAYCGRELSKAYSNGRLDHLDAGLSIGRNHISNRVLACNICQTTRTAKSNFRQAACKKGNALGLRSTHQKQQYWHLLTGLYFGEA